MRWAGIKAAVLPLVLPLRAYRRLCVTSGSEVVWSDRATACVLLWPPCMRCCVCWLCCWRPVVAVLVFGGGIHPSVLSAVFLGVGCFTECVCHVCLVWENFHPH
ncbi:uncharacterized protein LOC144463436 [Epinephelus lanceolatus]